MQPMNEVPFETVLGERVEAMLDACTRCGKCVEVCPSVEPAGISDTKSEDIIGGILELVRTATVRKHRANGRSPACRAGSASRRATTASIRASCLPWRGLASRSRTMSLPNDADRAWRGTATVVAE